MVRAFVSYSWDSDPHCEWVRELAARLRGDGIETILDQWHVVPGDQLPSFMETAVRESAFVLLVCTPRYKARSDKREGGVGYEGDIITGEVLTNGNARKFVPLLRDGEWSTAAPTWVAGKYYVDLRGQPYKEAQYEDLLATLAGTRPQPPPVGEGRAVPTVPSPAAAAPPGGEASSREADEPLRIVGLLVDEVGTPRSDGTRGSALYTVPFQLSRTPPPGWAEFFVRAWNDPPRYTSMHRPGIARVSGARVVLDGTTVEEVSKYHRDTLVLAVEEANRTYGEAVKRQRAREEQVAQRLAEHRRQVEEAAKKLKF